MYYVYFLKNTENKLYIGQTDDLTRRVKEHIESLDRAAKFTHDFGRFTLVYSEVFNTRLESMRREKQLKGWTRAKKEALISGNLELLKML